MTWNFEKNDFPKLFKYEIVNEKGGSIHIRCDAKSIDDINLWVSEYGKLNDSHWNFRTSIPNGKRILCS